MAAVTHATYEPRTDSAELFACIGSAGLMLEGHLQLHGEVKKKRQQGTARGFGAPPKAMQSCALLLCASSAGVFGVCDELHVYLCCGVVAEPRKHETAKAEWSNSSYSLDAEQGFAWLQAVAKLFQMHPEPDTLKP